MLLKDAVSSWCGDSLESSTFSMVLQQMMEPILTRGSFYRRPGDVPAENGWNRIEFLQGVIPAATQTDSLGLFRMLPSGRAQLTGIPPCTHGPWHKCRQDAHECRKELVNDITNAWGENDQA